MNEFFTVIGTGSRYWKDARVVRVLLNECLFAAREQDQRLLVRHGAHKSGADAHISRWCREFSVTAPGRPKVVEQPMPAPWDLYRKKAGPVRNSQMTAMGADVCLAFFMPCASLTCPRPEPHWSHGTYDCAQKAVKAGIRTLPEFRWTDGSDGLEIPDFLKDAA